MKEIIEINKLATEYCKKLEATIAEFAPSDNLAKDKADFGNIIVMLKGFRMIKEASEALLYNNDILKSPSGEFYAKIEDESEEHKEPTEKTPDETNE